MSRHSQALLSLSILLTASASAQKIPSHRVTITAGVPLHIALDERASYSKPGGELVGHLTQPVFVGDAVALPVGTKVVGHVAAVHSVSKQKRFDAVAAGDFTPLKDPDVEFDSLMLRNGKALAIQTSAVNRDSMTVQMGDKAHHGLWQTLKAQVKEQIATERKSVEETVESPHKLTRLKNAALARLPYHPQVFNEGARFVAELKAPVDVRIENVNAPEVATANTLPPADTILHARLLSELSSAKNHWGDSVEAALTEPVFGANHTLLLPEGTHLIGQVTRSNAARRWARNGRLSFTFKQVELNGGEKLAMKGRLTSVEGDRSANLSLDEEGNSTSKPSKAKHLVPLAMVMASQMSEDGDHRSGEEDGSGSNGVAAGGFGLTGRLLALSAGSRYVAYGIGYYGAARSIYAGFIGRGKDVVFPRNTQLEIRMDQR